MMASKNQMEDLINHWQYKFPGFPLTENHFKDPFLFVEALFFLLEKLGIDDEAIMELPSEEEIKELTPFYRDLIPVINMIRVISHLVCNTPLDSVEINLQNFLLPTFNKSLRIKLALFNLILFHEERIADVAPKEEKVFHVKVEASKLIDQKYTFLKELNDRAQRKAEKVEKKEALRIELKQLDEELKNEDNPIPTELKEVNDIKEEYHQLLTLYEQRKLQKEALLEEVAHKTALKVNDAEDVNVQVEQLKTKVAEVFKYIDSLSENITKKDNSLMNLNTVKSILDCGSNCLHDILENIKNSDENDLDEDDTKLLEAEVSEEQHQLSEMTRSGAQAVQKYKESDKKQKLQIQQFVNTLHETMKQIKRAQEEYATRLQETEESKAATNNQAQKKAKLIELIQQRREQFKEQCAAIEGRAFSKLL